MDYDLAALKLFCRQMKAAETTDSHPNAMSLFGILFQRAWLQGVLIAESGNGRFVLDDGTGVVDLLINPEFLPHQWKIGMYVMVVGQYANSAAGDCPLIKVHKIVDLSANPDREAMWFLEVIEAYNLFYRP